MVQVSDHAACSDVYQNEVLHFEGLISRGLAPHAKKIVGVDISEAMVKHDLS